MISGFFYGLLAVIFVSLVSLVGLFTFSIRRESLNKFIFVVVAFAAGSLLATAFFDLIPEGFGSTGSYSFVVFGILFFYLIESLIHWHHGHEKVCEDCIAPVAYLNLLGDGLHNFLDGVVIIAAFLSDFSSGIVVTISVILHEIPQEIGDFGVLLHSGLSRRKALFFNFLSSLSAIVGGIVAFIFYSSFERIIPYVLLIAAGGFIYIATADLFPELHKERSKKKILMQGIGVILGILLIALVLKAA